MVLRSSTTSRRASAASRALAIALLIALAAGTATATTHHHRHRRHAKPVPAPKPTPTVMMRPMVLVTGGTGTISVPTGESPAVLDSAELYDTVTGQFTATASMTSRRDRHAAVLMRDGRVLIAGGVDTVLVPLIVFPNPAMPSILSSCEIFDPAHGTFTATASMATARDESSATLLPGGMVLIAGGGDDSAELFNSAADQFVATGNMTESRYG